ncbi:MAG: hypothetical protein MZV64_15245 [Ignavibacteriales bacterium]|nr:hypothetical protein [Ignavibacteriales bacterium]
MTIAATYPAAVIGMAVLRLLQGLAPRGELRADGRLDRRVGGRRARSSRSRRSSSSRSGVRRELRLLDEYLTATALMIAGRHPGHPVRHDPAARSWSRTARCRSPSRWPPPRSTRPASAGRTRRCSSSGRWASARSSSSSDDFGVFQRRRTTSTLGGRRRSRRASCGSGSTKDAPTIDRGRRDARSRPRR